LRSPRIVAAGTVAAAAAVAVGLSMAHADPAPLAPTSTPIKHVVVIFNENESFDHYFGTYPNATNPPGEPRFNAAGDTPSVNGLGETLLDNNPNASLPQRLDRSEAVTCSQNHGYGAEQQAFDSGLMDKFVEFTAGGSCAGPRGKSIVMDYYDGNTVTALWNLAQHFSMNDNSYSSNFGPSTVGALNLVSGQTHGSDLANGSGVENNTVIGDPDPKLDDCAGGTQVAMSGKNIGDLLNTHNVSWGFFEGGFRPTSTVNGKAVCGARHVNVAGGASNDYIPHHQPFEYYASTTNQHHLAPSSPDKIGLTDQANHQYDLTDFDTALANNNLPSVSFLKPAAFEDAHPGNSDPLDEQRFIARALDALEQSPAWSSTAVIIAYDDSDGWYDHQMSPIVSPSANPADQLNGAGHCGNVKDATAYPDRCGYGPRQPFLVISPYAKQDFVDHSLTDQASIIKFIEDNWQLGRIGDQSFDARAGSIGNMFDFDPNDKAAPKLFLDPTTGSVLNKAPTDVPPLGTAPSVTPTPTATSTSVTTTVSGSVDATPTPTAAPQGAVKDAVATTAAKIRLACKTSGSGRKVTISCTAKGASSGATALRFRIVKGNKVLATAATRLSHGRAKVTLRAKKALKKGRYTLRISISHAGGVAGVTRTIKLG
jgi:phospholipase C